MAKKLGRPPIDAAKRASEMVPVRMTAVELALFKQAASKTHDSLSAWIRDSLTKAAKRALKR